MPSWPPFNAGRPSRREARAWLPLAPLLTPLCLSQERHPADQGLSCYEQPFEGKFTRWSFNLSGAGAAGLAGLAGGC